DDVTRNIQQRPSAVTRVNRSVGLDVEHGAVRGQMPYGGADVAHRKRVLQAQRATECDHNLPLPQLVRVEEGERGKVPSFDLEKGKVGIAVHAKDLCVEVLVVIEGAGGAGHHAHIDVMGSGDDVRVG